MPVAGPCRSIRPASAVAVAVAVAAASMIVWPGALTFDAWAWLVWGRQLVDGSLDTTGGPSWKPLPVLVMAAASPTGATPVVWSIVVRAATLLAMGVTYRLARRFVTWPFALAAVALVIVGPGTDPRWFRLALEGHTAPLAGGLVVYALDRHLAGRPGIAFWAWVLVGLMRPEAWPLLVAAGAWWVWWAAGTPAPSASPATAPPATSSTSSSTPAASSARSDWSVPSAVGAALAAVRRAGPRVVASVVVGIVVQPMLWLGGDLVGSGSPTHGAAAAQVGSHGFGERVSDLTAATVGLVPVVGWLAIAVLVVGARHRLARRDEVAGLAASGFRDRPLVLLAAVATAWWFACAVLTLALGYAALDRFFLPDVLVLSVLAAAGASAAWTRWRAERDRGARGGRTARAPGGVVVWGLLSLAVVAVVAGVAIDAARVVRLGDVAEDVANRAEASHALHDLLQSPGVRSASTDCPEVRIAGWRLPPQLAWELERPLVEIQYPRNSTTDHVLYIQPAERDDPRRGERIEGTAGGDRWTAYRLDC